MKAYHFLNADFTAEQGDEKPWEIGETRTIPATDRSRIVLCKYGYHCSPTLYDALMYAPGPLACLVEVPEDLQFSKEDFPKGVTYQRTLVAAVNVERELRLFAADCAERVLYLFERQYPHDKRPRQMIQAARDYANGKIGSAARDAAEDSAGAARPSGDAAWASGDAAWAAWAAGHAAWHAAWGAAAGAARHAAAGETATSSISARDAARDARNAAIKWQRQHCAATVAILLEGKPNAK